MRKKMFYSQHWVTETTLLTPLPVSFFRLSFVSRTFWLRNHMKFFIFNGIFNFHKYLLKNLAWPFSKSRYIDLTVKIPSKVSFHMNISLPWVSSTVISLWHKCNQLFHLPPVKTLLKEIFKGVCDKTVSTRTFFRWAMLYNDGYWADNGVSPNQVSSQIWRTL